MHSVEMTAVDRISETYHSAKLAGDRSAPYVSVPVALGAFVAGGALIAGLALAYRASILLGLGLYAFIAGPLCLATILSRIRQVSEAIETTVCLNDGVVTLTTSSEAKTCPLEQCCWFLGKAKDDSSLSYQPIRRKAIVLVFPTGRTIACGLSEAFHRQWLAAVRSSRCRRVLRQEGILGLLFSALSLSGLFAGLVVGGRLGAAIQDVAFPRPANNPFGNLIPVGLAIVLAWVLAIAPCFIPGRRRHTEVENRQITRFAILFPAKVVILSGVALGGNSATAIFLAIMFAGLLLLARAMTRHPTPARDIA